MAICLFMTSLKSVSSMKLHRDLDIAQTRPGISATASEPHCSKLAQGSPVRRK